MDAHLDNGSAPPYRCPVPSSPPGAWGRFQSVDVTATKRLRLFSGRSHPQLAKAIAAALGTELGGIQLETFADGDLYCRYTQSVRGADVFLVQTAVAPVDAHQIQLIMIIDAARLASRSGSPR